tara:strand:+ start:96 stop:587 length:492 start_codon:yes stop_codon:yes gene_type:complete
MKIDSKIIVVVLAGLGVLGYLYYKRKKDNEYSQEESNNGGLGGGGSFGLPPTSAPPITILNTPQVRSARDSQTMERGTVVGQAPTLSSAPISTGTTGTSGTIVDRTINYATNNSTPIARESVRSSRETPSSVSEIPTMSSSFLDFDGNEYIKRNALDLDLDLD